MTRRHRAAVAPLREGDVAASEALTRYLVRVLRLKSGASFVAFDPERATEADAVLEATSDGRAVLHVGPVRPAATRAAREVFLVQGLAKGDKCDAVVRDATELGATHVFIAACARSVVRLQGDRLDARLARFRRIATEAARQCGRGDPPRVELLGWEEAIARVPRSAHRFCLHVSPHGDAPLGPPLLEALADAPAGTPAPLAFAAGPEGGLTDEEVAFATEHGWAIASLGRFVLRTETAAAALLGAIRVFADLSPGDGARAAAK